MTQQEAEDAPDVITSMTLICNVPVVVVVISKNPSFVEVVFRGMKKIIPMSLI